MRTQRTASTLATDLADSHAPRRAGGDASRSRSKSRFSGSASAILSQLRSIGGGSRPATRSPGAASATVTAKEDPVGNAVQWINQQRRRVDAPRAGANGGVMKLTREQAVVMNKVVPKRAAPKPPTGASGATAKAQPSTTESSHTNPEIESDDELFELPLPATERAPQKTLLQLFNEEHAFQHAPASPAQMQTQNTAAAPEYDDDLIEVDLHSGRVNAGAKASEPSAPAGPKSALRKPGAARREAGPRVSWHPDVRDTKLASAASVATPATPTGPTGRARRSGITGMLGRMVQLPRKLWR
ncbi:hypothetical protein R75461_02676 [Paraburkholderia nemoris]|uniref:hypothetical protein n=1 Tax=Paraburkholderia nemoris TaxID=2793076 RepID=UPI00190996D9|nr:MULTISPECIES: hypothetical protein [Paraburkholderia]MBK3783770.1 hypothetical protein [Paraburkholderia aspalathi]CAE6745420.1 hypothetical protein R75461_02676 [Paraburkholderia nemoris]